MEKIILTCLFFYIALLAPWVFSLYPIIFLFFFLTSFVAIKIKPFDSLYLFALLLFVLFSHGYDLSYQDMAFSKESTTGIFCKVLSEPNARKNRKKGFRVEMEATRDIHGNIGTACGIIYVVTEDSDVHIFDEIYLDGVFYDELFVASSTELLRPWILSEIRNKLFYEIRQRCGYEDAGELMQMLLLGSSSRGDNSLSDKATSGGLRHILALSGMHLVVIMFFIKPLMILRKKGVVLSYFILLLFTWLSGWRPSLLRAFIFSILIKLTKDMDISFILSAVILLLIFPYYGFDLASIYSFTALSGILVFSKSIRSVLSYIIPVSAILDGFAQSISALITSIPISFFTFGSYQMLSIIFSLPMGFIISLYMGLAIICILLPFIYPIIKVLYCLIDKLFDLSSFLPMQTNLKPYAYMSTITATLLFMSKLKQIKGVVLKVIERLKS